MRNAVRASSLAWSAAAPVGFVAGSVLILPPISIGLLMAPLAADWIAALIDVASPSVPPWRPSQPNGTLNWTLRRFGTCRTPIKVPKLLVIITGCVPRSVPPPGWQPLQLAKALFGLDWLKSIRLLNKHWPNLMSWVGTTTCVVATPCA